MIKKLGFLFALIAVLVMSTTAFAATHNVATWAEFKTKAGTGDGTAADGDTINITADLTVTAEEDAQVAEGESITPAAGTTSSVVINKSLTINGNNHVIDGGLVWIKRSQTREQTINADALITVVTEDNGSNNVVIKDLSFKNVGGKSVDGGQAGESIVIYADTAFAGVLSIDNCVFEATNNTDLKTADDLAHNFTTGVLLGNTDNSAFTASVTNSTFKAGKSAIYGISVIPAANSKVTIANNTFEGCPTGTTLTPRRSSAIGIDLNTGTYVIEKNIIKGAFYSGVRLETGESGSAISFKENLFEVLPMTPAATANVVALTNAAVDESAGVAVWVKTTSSANAAIKVHNNVFGSMIDEKVLAIAAATSNNSGQSVLNGGSISVASMDVAGNSGTPVVYSNNIAELVKVMKYYYVAPDPTKPVVPVVKTTSVDISDASFDKTAGVAVVPSTSIAPVTTIEGLQSKVLIANKDLFTTSQGVFTVVADKLLEKSGISENERKEYQSVTFGAFNADLPTDAKIGIVMYELPFNAQTKGDINTMKFLKYGWDGKPIEFTRVDTLEAVVGQKYAVLSSDKKTPVDKLADVRYLIYGVADGALEDLDGDKNSKVVDPAMVSVKSLQSIAGVVDPTNVPDISMGSTTAISIDWYQYGETKEVAIVGEPGTTSRDVATAVISPASGINKHHQLVVSGHAVGSADISVKASSGALERTVVIRVNVVDPKGPSILSGTFSAPASMTVGQEIAEATSAWTFAPNGGTPMPVALADLDTCVIKGQTNLTVTEVSKGVFKVVAGSTIGAAEFTVDATYQGVTGIAEFKTNVEPEPLDPAVAIKQSSKFTFTGNVVKFNDVLNGNSLLLSASDLVAGYTFVVANNTVSDITGALTCDVEQTSSNVSVTFSSKTEGTYNTRVYLKKLPAAGTQAVPTDYTDVVDIQFSGKQPSGGSGGGCNAAYAPFALLLAAPLFFLRKKD